MRFSLASTNINSMTDETFLKLEVGRAREPPVTQSGSPFSMLSQHYHVLLSINARTREGRECIGYDSQKILVCCYFFVTSSVLFRQSLNQTRMKVTDRWQSKDSCFAVVFPTQTSFLFSLTQNQMRMRLHDIWQSNDLSFAVHMTVKRSWFAVLNVLPTVSSILFS